MAETMMEGLPGLHLLGSSLIYIYIYINKYLEPKGRKGKDCPFFFFPFLKVFLFIFKVVSVKLLSNSPNKVGHTLTRKSIFSVYFELFLVNRKKFSKNKSLFFFVVIKL